MLRGLELANWKKEPTDGQLICYRMAVTRRLTVVDGVFSAANIEYAADVIGRGTRGSVLQIPGITFLES